MRTILIAVATGVAIGLGLAGTVIYNMSVALERRPDPVAHGNCQQIRERGRQVDGFDTHSQLGQRLADERDKRRDSHPRLFVAAHDARHISSFIRRAVDISAIGYR